MHVLSRIFILRMTMTSRKTNGRREEMEGGREGGGSGSSEWSGRKEWRKEGCKDQEGMN